MWTHSCEDTVHGSISVKKHILCSAFLFVSVKEMLKSFAFHCRNELCIKYMENAVILYLWNDPTHL